MYFNPLGLHYSAQEALTLWNLKKKNFNSDIETSKIQTYCEKHQIWCIVQWDNAYPQRLMDDSQAPFLLYYQGNLSLLEEKILGIVGPRQPSEYGIQVLELFFEKASNFQLVSLSGFAKGVDQKTHQLSLLHNIPTIAVLGWGFQHYLRSSDRWFLAEIINQWGLILSEFKLWFQPTKRSFPQRNKLIAKLSEILFLPEAREKSWSLITAEFAYTMGKPIFSVPAPIFSPQSAGVFAKMNEQKIQLITDFDACLQKHFPQKGAVLQIEKTSLTDRQIELLQYLEKQGDSSLESLLAYTHLSYGELLQELTFLEIDKKIQEIWPWIYRKKK